MNTFIDHSLLQKISAGEKQNLLNDPVDVTFGWPTFLGYLGLGSLFDAFPKFDEQNQLFVCLTCALASESTKDLMIRIYDQLFVECLTQVKALGEINSAHLLNLIQTKRSSEKPNSLFLLSLQRNEKALLENPYHTIHDLTLYLAWDRMCVNLATAFDFIYPEIKTTDGLTILKECLLESFQHITEQGKTSPGFFRLVEALFAYEMREENLQLHTDSEWEILCQSSKALRSREHLSDIFYIDAALTKTPETLLRIYTLDSPDRVNSSFSLARLMNKKANWQYIFSPVEVVCIKESESGLVIDTVLQIL